LFLLRTAKRAEEEPRKRLRGSSKWLGVVGWSSHHQARDRQRERREQNRKKDVQFMWGVANHGILLL
jgi:hypothetical protein